MRHIPIVAGSMGVTMALNDDTPKDKVLIIYSGGMDSTTLLYDLYNKNNHIEALWFNYGQKHNKEHKYAKNICNKLNIKYSEVNLENLNDFFSNSSLSGNKDIPNVMQLRLDVIMEIE